jgi:hypothetical protein
MLVVVYSFRKRLNCIICINKKFSFRRIEPETPPPLPGAVCHFVNPAGYNALFVSYKIIVKLKLRLQFESLQEKMFTIEKNLFFQCNKWPFSLKKA